MSTKPKNPKQRNRPWRVIIVLPGASKVTELIDLEPEPRVYCTALGAE